MDEKNYSQIAFPSYRSYYAGSRSEVPALRIISRWLVVALLSLLTVTIQAQPAKSPWPKFHANPANTGQGLGYGGTNVQKWAVDMGPVNTNHGNELSPSIGVDGTVYVISYSGSLVAIDGVSGSVHWTFTPAEGPLWTPMTPAIGLNGDVYVGSLDGYFYAVDSSTGALVWSNPTGLPINDSPAIGSDGTVYVPCYGSLLALNG